MRVLVGLALLALARAAPVPAQVPSLTADDFDRRALLDGKDAFVKFFAPWCGHCKKMAPDYARLAAEFADDPSVFVAEVDCTAEQALCQRFNVEGFPTLRTFSAASAALGDAYTGGRTYDDLKKHVAGLAAPRCGPDARDNCTAAELSDLDDLLALAPDALGARIADLDAAVKAADDQLGRLMGILQTQYEAGKEQKERAVAELAPRLRLARSLARLKKGGAETPKTEL